MSKILNNSLSFLALSLFFLTLNSCSYLSSKDEKADSQNQIEKIVEKKRFEPNLDKRTREAVDSGKVTIFGQKKDSGKEFGKNNVLWDASLSVLEDIPLKTLSYEGGIIVTDWYSSNSKSEESIQIKINIVSNEIKTSSIIINSLIKKCDGLNNCKINKSSENFNSKIKEAIINKIREIEISKSKN